MKEESPLTKRINWVLTHARSAYKRDDLHKRKWNLLPNGGEIHIQCISENTIRVAIARVGTLPEQKGLNAFHAELNTILKYWPEPDIVETNARKLLPPDETGRYWLIATITTRPQQPGLI